VAIGKFPRSKKRVPRAKVDVTTRNVEAMTRRMESAVQLGFAQGIGRFKNNVAKIDLDRAFNARGYNGLMETIPWADLPGHMGKVAAALDEGMQGAHEHVIQSVRKVRPEYRQDGGNPRLGPRIKARQRQFMQDLDAETRTHIQTVAQRAARTGASSAQVAQEIKDGLGLNQRQQRALLNYRKNLTADAQAGKRAYRGIDGLVDSYAQRLLQARAKTIAITESRQAAAGAQLAAWGAMMGDGVVEPHAHKRWVLGWPNACPEICYPMAGKEVRVDQPWKLPNGKLAMVPNDAHPNCRCYMSLETDDGDS